MDGSNSNEMWLSIWYKQEETSFKISNISMVDKGKKLDQMLIYIQKHMNNVPSSWIERIYMDIFIIFILAMNFVMYISI